MFIKICANTNLEDALLAAELGADAVGFVFAPSKRQVTPEEVAAITPYLPAGVERVGVFAPADVETLDEALAVAGLTAVQLHGEFWDWQIEGVLEKTEGNVKLLQVVGFEVDSEDPSLAREHFERRLVEAVDNPAIWAVLLDAAKSGGSGGLGLSFDWTDARQIVDRVYAGRKNPPKLIVAGGLRPDNVAEAIATFAPFGVDVASGVEATPGKKDTAKLRAFIEAAKSNPATPTR
jgi:phosphoribosylanthranilate isomerase